MAFSRSIPVFRDRHQTAAQVLNWRCCDEAMPVERQRCLADFQPHPTECKIRHYPADTCQRCLAQRSSPTADYWFQPD